MEGDKDDNDQSDNIKSNEGHSDKKLPMVYHSKLIGATKMLTRILHKIIILTTDISFSRRLDETESKAATIKSNSLK